jgi:hypothetical protein
MALHDEVGNRRLQQIPVEGECLAPAGWASGTQLHRGDLHCQTGYLDFKP